MTVSWHSDKYNSDATEVKEKATINFNKIISGPR